MIKSKKWCLNRLHHDGIDKIFYLNEGKTTIGRNRSADISSTSTICSRDHCVITLNPDDTIVIGNKVSNKMNVQTMVVQIIIFVNVFIAIL